LTDGTAADEDIDLVHSFVRFTCLIVGEFIIATAITLYVLQSRIIHSAVIGATAAAGLGASRLGTGYKRFLFRQSGTVALCRMAEDELEISLQSTPYLSVRTSFIMYKR
jgi:hypothetical protein